MGYHIKDLLTYSYKYWIWHLTWDFIATSVIYFALAPRNQVFPFSLNPFFASLSFTLLIATRFSISKALFVQKSYISVCLCLSHNWLYASDFYSPLCRKVWFFSCFLLALNMHQSHPCHSRVLLWMLICSPETASVSLNTEALHYLLWERVPCWNIVHRIMLFLTSFSQPHTVSSLVCSWNTSGISFGMDDAAGNNLLLAVQGENFLLSRWMLDGITVS